MDYRRRRHEENSEDWPTYSRLFIVCERNVSEDDIRDNFKKFGTIEDIRIPKDHNTGEPKGIVFIKFSKTSEAATALEEMNLKTLPNSNRALKVMVAANRSDIQSDDDDEKYKRLFLNIAKYESESTLQETFGQFGEIEYIIVQRDRNTGQPKGFAYIKFRRFSEAARAFENCDKKYRAIFAQPKGYNKRHETRFESNINNIAMSTNNMMQTSFMSMMNVRPQGYTSVNYMCSPYLTQPHVERLFDLVPGMTDCRYFVDLLRNFVKGTVTYSNPISAAYAVQKLNKFEYPPGMKIFVKPDNSMFDPYEQNFNSIPNTVTNLRNAITATSKSATPDLAQLAEAIAEATKLVKMVTGGPSDDSILDSCELNYCSAKLPRPQPLADIDSPVEKRCFLVCKPQPPPLTVLRDVFCRFGNLINVYTLPNKTVGYARYAVAASADEAIKVLHGAEICGVRIKVIEAEEKPDDYDGGSSKRMKYEEM